MWEARNRRQNVQYARNFKQCEIFERFKYHKLSKPYSSSKRGPKRTRKNNLHSKILNICDSRVDQKSPKALVINAQ